MVIVRWGAYGSDLVVRHFSPQSEANSPSSPPVFGQSGTNLISSNSDSSRSATPSPTKLNRHTTLKDISDMREGGEEVYAMEKWTLRFSSLASERLELISRLLNYYNLYHNKIT